MKVLWIRVRTEFCSAHFECQWERRSAGSFSALITAICRGNISANVSEPGAKSYLEDLGQSAGGLNGRGHGAGGGLIRRTIPYPRTVRSFAATPPSTLTLRFRIAPQQRAVEQHSRQSSQVTPTSQADRAQTTRTATISHSTSKTTSNRCV
jgi:hypothetical protein